MKDYEYLTPKQRDQFLEKGYIKIDGAVREEYLDRFTKDAWVRLGMDPNDKSTWTKEKVRHLSKLIRVLGLDLKHLLLDPHASPSRNSDQRVHAEGLGRYLYVVCRTLINSQRYAEPLVRRVGRR